MSGFRVRMDRITHKKAYLVLAVFVLLAVLLTVKLFSMQVINYEYYQNLVVEQMTTEVEVNPERGTIYDTNGKVIAGNATRYILVISPQDILDVMAPEDNAEQAEEEKDEGFLLRVVNFLISLRQKVSEEEKFEEKLFTYVSSDGVEETGLRMNELIAKFLSETVEGVEYDKVIEKTQLKGRRYEVIAKSVDEETADKIRKFIETNELKLQVYLVASSVRYYPYNELAAHVIGFTDADGTGIYGIEQYYNNIMEGTSGRYITAQDARHQDMPFEYETYVREENGYNIVTTLDMYIQYELENQLENALKDHKAANRVSGIVMDVNTGGILAMATAPTFDLNDPRTLNDESQAILSEYTEGTTEYANKRLELLYTMWKNKAVTETYEPGSTFKIVTTAMALEEKVVRTDEMFTCIGQLTVEGYPKPIHCHKAGGHGTVTFTVGLQQSCNPVLMTIGMRLGQERFYSYFEKFGYKSTTGIDVPSEAGTYSHKFSDFTIPSLAVYSFGQTFKTTPIQQITAIASVANGGNLVTPHVMKEIVDADGNVIQSYETNVKRQVVSSDTCKTISQILEEGVSGDGGARNAYVKGYKVAAKTGTSEKRDKADENGEFSLRVGSCVAYAPADNPQIAVIIMVDEPMGGSVYGSVVAAPYVSNLMSFILPYLGYEPVYSEEELKNAEVTVPSYVGASIENTKADLEWRGIAYEIVGDGNVITSQTPAAGTSMKKENGVLYLYTDGEVPSSDIEVPDLVGKTAEAANRIAVNAGLNISISGATNGSTATVTSQSPAPGEKVPKGTLITISLRHDITSDD